MPHIRRTCSDESFEMATVSMVHRFLSAHRFKRAYGDCSASFDPEREFFGIVEPQKQEQETNIPVKTPDLVLEQNTQCDYFRRSHHPWSSHFPHISTPNQPDKTRATTPGHLLTPWYRPTLSSFFLISLGLDPASSDTFVRTQLTWHPFWDITWTISLRSPCCNMLRVDMVDDLDVSPAEDDFVLIERGLGNREYDIGIMMARNGFRKVVVPGEDIHKPWVWMFEPVRGIGRRTLMPVPLEDLKRETSLEVLEADLAEVTLRSPE